MLVGLYCIRNHKNKILGFTGVSGPNLEMLFMNADARVKGLEKTIGFCYKKIGY